MKRKLKALAAVLLVLVMLGSAMPMQLAAEAMTPPTIDTISTDGYGFIGVSTEWDENYGIYYCCIEAASVPGNSFCGWYAVDGTLLSTNIEINRNDFDGVNDFIAKFTASTPGGVGDVDGDGAVRVSDAVLIMRYALGLIEFTPEQILCGDVDGDGFVKVADAVMVIRIALGLV